MDYTPILPGTNRITARAATGRRRRRAAALLAVSAVAVGAGPAAAADGPRSPNTVLRGTESSGLARVLAPAPGGMVKGGTARIRVRLRPGARSFQAWLDTTDVTRLFRRRGNDRVATISASRTRALRLGVNHLFVRVRAPGDRRDFDYVGFTRARRMPSLLVQRRTGRVVGAGQVRITFSVARRSATVRASMNGHRVRGVGGHGSRRRSYVLDADDGLRFGRNSLKFVAVHNSGRFDVERRTITIPRSVPIPSAGHSRRVLAKRVVRLDATRSRPARPGGELRFRWRIVQAPRGSKAKLRRVTSARPALRPDRVGRYRLRLTVRGRSTGAAAARAAVAADTITLHATPSIPPVGVPIDTAAAPIGEGVHLGAPLNTRYVAPNRNEPIQMVALDRTDLSKVANNSYTGDATGTAQLVSDVGALTSSDLVIITTPSSSQSRAITDPQAQANLNQAVNAIGGAALPAKVLSADGCIGIDANRVFCTNFSVIGVPGQDAGTADENAGLTLVSGRNAGQQGSLVGYLQADQNGKYHYVNGDFVGFDTSTPATTATQNVMSINGQTFASDTLPSGQAGFQLVIMASDTLDLQLNVTYAVSGAGLSDDDAANGLSAISGLLATAANDPGQLVFLQSIGSVVRNDGGEAATLSWNSLATELSGVGSHAFYFNALNGQGDGGTYAFVGPGNAPSFLSPWARTASTLSTGTAGQLSGVLARNTSSQYYPKLAGTEASLDFSLPFVLYQQPVDWPDRDTPGHLAALSCITQALDLPPGPIEDNYLNQNFDFSSVKTSLEASAFTFQGVQTAANPECQNPTFTQQDFTDVQGQIAQELGAGAGVKNLITNLQAPLGTSADNASANVLDIAQAIQSSLGKPDTNASGDTSEVLVDLMYVASAIVPEGGEALGVSASIASLANAALDDSSGGPLMGPLQTTATQLLVDFAEDYESLWAQIGTTGSILFSDWGKLRTAYQRSLTSWSWSSQNTTNGADALTAASKLFTFEALVPLEYQTYDFGDKGWNQSLPVPPPDGRDYQCPAYSLQTPDNTTLQDFQPFAGAPSPGLTVVTQAGPVTDLWMLGSTDRAFLSNESEIRNGATGPIPATIYNAMFTDPVNENISSPTLPSELRFDLDVYDGPGTLTYGGYEPDVYCNYNGQRAYQGGSP